MMGRFFSGLAQSDCGDSGGSRSRESMSRDEGFALALKDTGMVYSWGRGTKVRGCEGGECEGGKM